MTAPDDLRRQVERQARRMKKAEHERPTLAGQTVYLGTLGLLLVLPIIGGAYLGDWLDTRAGDYSIHWTIGLLLAGVVVGAMNVYFYTRE